MGVKDFRDFACWQLSYALKDDIVSFTATGPASRDFKFRDQIRDSAASTPRNISEGFGRYRPAEFARFLEFARASLMETQVSLIDAHDRGYLDDRLFSRLKNLAGAALRATTNLMLRKQRDAARSAKPRKHSRDPKAPSAKAPRSAKSLAPSAEKPSTSSGDDRSFYVEFDEHGRRKKAG